MAVGIAALTILIIYRYYICQKNIFFTEYEGTYENEHTTIYKYNSRINAVIEIGSVQGKLQDCVINGDETYITGIIKDESFEIIRYDLDTKSIETLEAANKIASLTDNSVIKSKVLLYSGGDKIYVPYRDKNQDEKWLFYDLNTGQYDIVEGETSMSLTIHNGNMWYIADNGTMCTGTLYQYNLESKERNQIMESVSYDSVIMPETGLVAYTKGNSIKEIYLYDMKTQENSCIARGGWNTYYGDLLWTNSRWSDNGREFFFVKSFPGLFNESTERLMIYDVLTHRSRCIYKASMTTNNFQYVMKR